MNSQTLTKEDYTVGWICALPIELTAALAVLDERHPPLRAQLPSDCNTYTLGRVGDHNVVIACLPAGQTGTNPAVTVAVHMKSTFGSTQFGLLVGIGGGVPGRNNDIRLGDVVVSKPRKQNGGIVQYDYGKTVQQGRLVRTGSLNAPPWSLLTPISLLESQMESDGNRFIRHSSKLLAKSKFAYQGADNDQLFAPSYNHIGGSTCEKYDDRRLVQRHARDSSDPIVHYGTIASGNQVMRDGVTRDRLSNELEALCFEMEAAGLMNDYPCIVIRGIYDYADSHKNKQWQGYVAATAAAYAKELLDVIPCR
jgi:nucleoside phosphorylase